MPHTTTNKGLHEFVVQNVLARHSRGGVRAADLVSGPGLMAAHLRSVGCEVVAADREATGFVAGLPHVVIDFNQPDFAAQMGAHSFDLITAIEVIEHVESPIGFLRNIGQLLAPGGVAVLTTPNVDSLPARLKFLFKGKIRTMDERSEPTHISPIFYDLLVRQYLPLARLRMREHLVFPANGFQLTRPIFAVTLRMMSAVIPGENLLGDNHVFVLESCP